MSHAPTVPLNARIAFVFGLACVAMYGPMFMSSRLFFDTSINGPLTLIVGGIGWLMVGPPAVAFGLTALLRSKPADRGWAGAVMSLAGILMGSLYPATVAVTYLTR